MTPPRNFTRREEHSDNRLKDELLRDVREIFESLLKENKYEILHEFVQTIASFIAHAKRSSFWYPDERYGQRLLNLAMISEKSGEYSRAFREATNAIETFARLEKKPPPGEKMRWLGNAMARRGLVNYRNGKFQNAEEDLREALKAYGNWPWGGLTTEMCSIGDIRKMLGYTLYQEGKKEEARATLEEAQSDYRTEWGSGEDEVNEIREFLRSQTFSNKWGHNLSR